MTPDQMLLEAKRLTSDADSGVRGSWPRAAAFLGRMALEDIVDEQMKLIEPDLVNASMRSRLLCVSLQLGEEAAADLRVTWAGLSSACHQHSYEFAPTAGELNGWFARMERLTPEARSLAVSLARRGSDDSNIAHRK